MSGLATNQFCLLLGEDEVFPVEVFDGGGVQLAQADHSVVLGPRDAMLLQWTGTTWRQVDQFSVSSGGSSEPQGLQANCGVNCVLSALTEERPYIKAPADDPATPEIEGPQEHIFSPDGNYIKVRYSAPGVLAGPEQMTIEPDTCWSVQARLGPPFTVLPVGSVCNVGGVSVSRNGIFEIPDASAIEFQPVPSLPATNVQSALAELAAQVGGGPSAEQFQDTTFTLPSQTYGIANEACESANVGAGDLLLSTTDAWEAAIENVANAEKHIFLTAGTYTLTSDLDLAAGVVLRPQNCAAVTIAGTETSGIRPCQQNVIAGFNITRVRPSGSVTESAIEYSRGLTCSGSIVRNNDIYASGATSVGFTNGSFSDTYTRGNRFIAGGTLSDTDYTGFIGSGFDIDGPPLTCTPVIVHNVIFEENMHDNSPGPQISKENAYHAGFQLLGW